MGPGQILRGSARLIFDAVDGVTPVYLRYNPGRHISENGRDLAHRLQALVDAWPVPVEAISILAHSMGGLVSRSGGPPSRRTTHACTPG